MLIKSGYAQDLSRLGRDLRRCVLVDDTPLAFLAQPDNGIPIFNFRGDVDDRVLVEVRLGKGRGLTHTLKWIVKTGAA